MPAIASANQPQLASRQSTAAGRRRGRREGRPLAPRLARLAALTHRRWALAVLAELHRGDTHPGGCKFITLTTRLGLSRETLADTLQHLVQHDYVLRNPGYGHPMRPEYLLAEEGYTVASACARLIKWLSRSGLADAASRKWSLPTLMAMATGVTRFNELKAVLPGITARALTLALKDLFAAALIAREVTSGFPPSTRYTLTSTGRRAAAMLHPIAATSD